MTTLYTNEIDDKRKCRKINNITIYDKECLERYGPKTCILLESYDKKKVKMYEIRYLDKADTKGDVMFSDHLYEMIPYLLSESYTVVVVDKVEQKYEITAIHKSTGDFFSILNFY
jgi:hypothetical protein